MNQKESQLIFSWFPMFVWKSRAHNHKREKKNSKNVRGCVIDDKSRSAKYTFNCTMRSRFYHETAQHKKRHPLHRMNKTQYSDK